MHIDAAKALLQAAQARVGKRWAASDDPLPTPAAPAPASAHAPASATSSAGYSITASLGLTLLVDAEAAVRAHLESVLALARGLNGLTLQVSSGRVGTFSMLLRSTHHNPSLSMKQTKTHDRGSLSRA